MGTKRHSNGTDRRSDRQTDILKASAQRADALKITSAIFLQTTFLRLKKVELQFLGFLEGKKKSMLKIQSWELNVLGPNKFPDSKPQFGPQHFFISLPAGQTSK